MLTCLETAETEQALKDLTRDQISSSHMASSELPRTQELKSSKNSVGGPSSTIFPNEVVIEDL
jgi:hypothetical protein